MRSLPGLPEDKPEVVEGVKSLRAVVRDSNLTVWDRNRNPERSDSRNRGKIGSDHSKQGEDMRLRYLAVLPLLMVSFGVVQADDAKPEPVPSAARVAWLKQHVAPVRSLDPADDNFTDLEPIRKAVGDARIVFLSEEWHGSGATFQARNRVIRFLHQKCGFDVLAFESGLYDCRKTWELLKEGKMPALEAASLGIFGTWTGTEECRPMFEYLGKQARQPRPLEVCGFDCQFTGPASRRFLPEELAALFKKLPADSLTTEQRETVVKAFAKLTVTGTVIDGLEKDALVACRKALTGAKSSEALSSGELAFWRQFLDSSLGMAEIADAYKAGIKGGCIPRKWRCVRCSISLRHSLLWLGRFDGDVGLQLCQHIRCYPGPSDLTIPTHPLPHPRHRLLPTLRHRRRPQR
jgi:Erythromycin esterase